MNISVIRGLMKKPIIGRPTEVLNLKNSEPHINLSSAINHTHNTALNNER